MYFFPIPILKPEHYNASVAGRMPSARLFAFRACVDNNPGIFTHKEADLRNHGIAKKHRKRHSKPSADYIVDC